MGSVGKGDRKTTDLLLDCVEMAAVRDFSKVETALEGIKEKHFKCIAELQRVDGDGVGLSPVVGEELRRGIVVDLADLRDVLKTVSLMKWNPPKISELVSGYGELWSSGIVAAVMRRVDGESGVEYVRLDARKVRLFFVFCICEVTEYSNTKPLIHS